MEYQYDLIVIGAGSGGLVVATTANRKGLKVAMLEKNKIGGECTHSGCVPSKALIQSAKQYHAQKHLSAYGLPAVAPAEPFDFAKVMTHVDGIVQGIYEHETPAVWEKQGIAVYVHSSGAKFQDAHTVTIGPDTLTARNFVICTGSAPAKLTIPGSEDLTLLDNESFWEIREQPQSMVFVGGGVISVELGQAMNRLGTSVTILERNSRILKVVDEAVAQVMIETLSEEGVQILANTQLKSFRKEGENTIVVIEQDGQTQELTTDVVFVAAGRSPHVGGMDLEKAGVTYSQTGISVNEFLQTTAPHIYACGDVASAAKFTHVAAYQATICVDNILEENTKASDLNILPWAIFSEPEIAHVGLTEAQARQQYGADVKAFTVNATVDRFLTDGKTKGFLKMIFGPNQEVLGADAIGAHAGEWTQLVTLIMKHKLPLEQFVYTIFSYPTYSEIVKKVITRYLRTL